MAINSIPWWLRICAKIILSRLPFGYAVWQRLGLFRHGSMDNSEYALRVFLDHVEKAGIKNQLEDKTVLELGPGDSIASAIIASAYNARAILVDVGPFVRKDIEPYKKSAQLLKEQNLGASPSLDGCHTVEEVLERCNGCYMTEGMKSLKTIKDDSVDLIFSQAVLEHMRSHDFLEIMKECRRILKTDGRCSHQVDLRDHLGGALNNLRFSERTWESSLFVNSGFYTNRIRFEQMLSFFEKAGFAVDVSGVQRWKFLPTPRRKLAKEFRRLSDEDLCIYQFDVILS